MFHTARTLIRVIRREIGNEFDRARAEVAVIAALLYDLGHGPFSHTFEGVQRAHGLTRKHEAWFAEIIRNPDGQIAPLLASHRNDAAFGEEVATLLEAEDPIDIYHAVVSSSFDADRLDYLRRDRLMTGTGAGAIDFDWRMDHLGVREVALEACSADSSWDQKAVIKEEAYGRLGRERVAELVQKFVWTNVTVLELAATIDWLWRVEKCADWRGEIVKRKGRKVQGGRLEKALDLLQSLGLAPPPNLSHPALV